MKENGEKEKDRRKGPEKALFAIIVKHFPRVFVFLS